MNSEHDGGTTLRLVDARPIPFLEHPLRRTLTEEMHLRRMPHLEAPCRAVQFVVLTGEGGGEQDRAHAQAFLATIGGKAVASERYLRFSRGNIAFVWERHTEFSTYTLIRAGTVFSAIRRRAAPAPRDELDRGASRGIAAGPQARLPSARMCAGVEKGPRIGVIGAEKGPLIPTV